MLTETPNCSVNPAQTLDINSGSLSLVISLCWSTLTLGGRWAPPCCYCVALRLWQICNEVYGNMWLWSCRHGQWHELAGRESMACIGCSWCQGYEVSMQPEGTNVRSGWQSSGKWSGTGNLIIDLPGECLRQGLSERGVGLLPIEVLNTLKHALPFITFPYVHQVIGTAGQV